MQPRPLNDFVQRLCSAVLPGANETTDAELVTAFLERRDHAALTALIHRHGPMVWGVCRRLLRDHHAAEDAFQATFLVLVRKAATIRQRERVAAWLHGVAQQTALKARTVAARTRRREKQVALRPDQPIRDQELWHDVRELLDQEVSALPAEYRAVVVLCDVEGRTRQEAARELGWPEGTVAGRLARARQRLAKRLSRRGVALTSSAVLAAVVGHNAASAAVPSVGVSSTIKAATLVAAGQGLAAAGISPEVAAITEGVIKSMYLTKTKIAIAVLALGLFASVGVGGLVYRTYAAPPSVQVQVQGGEQKDKPNSVNAAAADDKKPDEAKGEGKLSGIVRLAGKPVTSGKVVVVNDDGKSYEGPLDDKGSYTINDGKPIPTGNYKVAIVSDDALMRKKYGDAKTSGFTAVVTKDNTPASFSLKTNKDEGKLFGLVRVDGKILVGGKVILHDSDGTTYEGPLDDKGDYKINDGKPIPSETYKVTMISDDPLLPKKYAELKTSDLTVTVTSKGIPMSWNLRSK